MKILIFHQFYTRLNEPGIARFNLFADYWQRSKVETEVIAGMINYQTGKKKEEYKRKLFFKEKDGVISVVRVFDSALGYRTFLGRIISYVSFLFFSFLAGIFSKRSDVIIVSSPPIFLGLIGYLISILKRTPFVLELRDLWPDEVIELGYVKNKFVIRVSYSMEKFLYERAKFIVVNSPGFKDFLIDKKNIDESKIGVIPNPISLESLELNNREIVRRNNNWQDKFVILYCGAHSFVYNFEPLIEAAKELRDKKDILFVLVGDGRQKPSLVERVKKEKLGNIEFHDPVPKNQINSLINAADVGIVPLSDMGLLKYVYATKIFDYMANKKPIILAMSGVSADLVCRDAKCGLCVKLGDSEKMKNAVLEFYNNRLEAQKMGENGYDFAKNNLSADILAKRYLDLLEPIIVPKRESD